MSNNKKGAIDTYNRNKNLSDLESVSGTGSTISVTKNFVGWLNDIISKYEIESVIDVPCGDWNWMRRVDLGGAKYHGYDIVDEMISENDEFYGGKDVKFSVHDIVNEEIDETADLVIVRDFLFHLSFEDASNVINHIKDIGSKYLITTTFDHIKNNTDLTDDQKSVGWGWRAINVESEPYNLKYPRVDSIIEPSMNNRKQVLYKL